MEVLLIVLAATAVFGFVGYQLYKSRSSQPTTSGGGRTQSTNPSSEVEREVEEKLDRKDRAIREYNESKSSSQPKRKTSSSRSSKPRKSTPRKTSGGNKGGGSKKSTPRKSGGSGKRTNNKNVNKSK